MDEMEDLYILPKAKKTKTNPECVRRMCFKLQFYKTLIQQNTEICTEDKTKQNLLQKCLICSIIILSADRIY